MTETWPSTVVECIGVGGIDHFLGRVIVEAGACHGGEVAVAMVLAVLGAIGPEPAPPGQRRRGFPFALAGIGVELLVEAGPRLVERVAIDAGELPPLACEAGRGGAAGRGA